MHRLRWILGFPALFLVIAGCGDLPRGRVHGTIKYQGKALTNATVMFFAQDNQVYRGDLKDDGAYSVDGVPQGPVRVAIQQALPSMPARPDPPAFRAAKSGVNDEKANAPRPDPPPSTPRELAFQLPPTYANPDQSNLTFDLKESVQEWSIDLK